MAKKKASKKDAKKKANKKEFKKKIAKKKTSKKEAKKKDSKKKKTKKKSSKKKLKQVQPLSVAAVKPSSVAAVKPSSVAAVKPKAPENKFTDHSSNYKVTDAIKKLRSLKKSEELLAFTKGEKRLTITRVLPAALRRKKK